MLALFESYEMDYTKCISSTNKLINGFHLLLEEKKELTVNLIKKNLTDAENNLKQMEVEFSMLPQASKNSVHSKLKKYRTEIEEVRKKFFKIEELYIELQQKKNLFGNKQVNIEMNTKSKLVNNNEMLLKQQNQFKNMMQVAEQTDQTAIQIQATIKEQRDKILDATAITKDTHQDLVGADRIIKLMTNREMFNKLILIALVVLLSLANIIALYLRVKSAFS